MNYRQLVVLVVFMLGICHAEERLFKRVINGEEVPPDTYPWAVSIKGNNPVTYGTMGVCGATLINDQWLVTAAHCFYVMNSNEEFVPNLDVKNWHLQAGNALIDLNFNEKDEETEHSDEDFVPYKYGTVQTPTQTRTSITTSIPRVYDYYTRRQNLLDFNWNKYDKLFDSEFEMALDQRLQQLEYKLQNLFRQYGMYDKRAHIKRALKSMNDQAKRKMKKDKEKSSSRRISKRGERQHLHISKIIIHPNYDPSNLEWDIALMKLNRPVHYQHFSGINPVDLPASDVGVYWPTNGEECVLIGWGCQKAGGSAVNKAQLARLNVMPNSRCKYLYDYRAGINSYHEFCAGFYQKGHGICPGDSGSGLVCKTSGRWVLSGVTSATHYKKPEDYPGIFTRVSYFRKWIDEQIIMEE